MYIQNRCLAIRLPIEIQHAIVSAGTSAVRGRSDNEDVLQALEVVENKLGSFVTGGAGAALGTAGDGQDDDFEVVASRRGGEAPQLSENGRDVIGEGARPTNNTGPELRNNIPESDDVEQENNAQRTGSSVAGPRGDNPDDVGKDGQEERGTDQGGGPLGDTRGADSAASRRARSSSAASNLSIWSMDGPRLEGGKEADASGDVGRAPEARDDTPVLDSDGDEPEGRDDTPALDSDVDMGHGPTHTQAADDVDAMLLETAAGQVAPRRRSEVPESDSEAGSGPGSDHSTMDVDQEDEESDDPEGMGSPSKRQRLNRGGHGARPSATMEDMRGLFGGKDWGGKVDVAGKKRRSAAGPSSHKEDVGGGRHKTGERRSDGEGGLGDTFRDEDWAGFENAADEADREAEERRLGAEVGPQPGESTNADPTGMMRGLTIADTAGGDEGRNSSQTTPGRRKGRGASQTSPGRRKPSTSPDAPYRPTARPINPSFEVAKVLGAMGGKVAVPPNPNSGTRVDVEESSSGLSSEEDADPVDPTPSADKGKGKAPRPSSSPDSDNGSTSPVAPPKPPVTTGRGKGKDKATGTETDEEMAAEEGGGSKDPLGGTWRWWKEACNIILDMCRPGAADPVAAVATALQMAMGPRGQSHDIEPTALMRDSANDDVLLAMRTLERSYDLSASAGLPLLVDLCAFVITRREELVREQQEGLQGQLVARSANRSLAFKAANGSADSLFTKKGKFDDSRVSTTGARVLGVTTLLGSLAFLPLMLRSEEFQGWKTVRDAPAPRYYALSVLLRGGRPKVDDLQPAQRQLVDATVFAAKEILPRILQAYLWAVFMLYDDAVDKGKQDLRHVLFAAPLESAATELGRDPANFVAPQSPMIRVQPGMDQVEKPPLLLGLMSGYGDLKKPVVNPAYFMLFRNFNKIAEHKPDHKLEGLLLCNPLRDTRESFAEAIDPSYPLAPDTPVCQTRPGGPEMLQFVGPYCLQMGLDKNSSAVGQLISAVTERKPFVGPYPDLYTGAKLRQIEEERAAAITRTAGERFQPAQDDEDADAPTQGTSASRRLTGGEGQGGMVGSSQSSTRLALSQQAHSQRTPKTTRRR
ncbi:hypothetical protein A4X13_0g7386 [Tilletia indica]|uniref:Uncharacterized protein n=1 Tax=Tilletia indica TaxID=43049 RepID=A0A8T8SK15_9BASI|nr:hypothetical protein A4X13_0g7386 [Tilletia indica]